MKPIIILLAGVFFLSGCSANRINTEFKFGNKLAARGLWKEAHFRWTKALEKGDKSAAIHNNIAISLEYQDKLKEAEAEYLKALELSPGNEYIKRNLSRLKKRLNPEIGPESEKTGQNKKSPVKKGKRRKR